RVIQPCIGSTGYFVRSLRRANWKAVDAIFAYRTEKASRTMSFARTKSCRQTFILNYFGETSAGDCGICDNCRRDNALSNRTGDSTNDALLQSAIRAACQKISKTLRVPPMAILSEDKIRQLSKEP